MKIIIPILLISITFRLIGKFLVNIINQKKKKNEYTEIKTTEDKSIEYHNKYEKKLLLTKNEWYEYKKLKEIVSNKGYQICPKVRLLDLVEPRRGDTKYKSLLYKIQAKHVDFVICDQDLHVKAILELDDNSHNQIERKERDEFVDLILKEVGYTVIRTRSITEEILNIIT